MTASKTVVTKVKSSVKEVSGSTDSKLLLRIKIDAPKMILPKGTTSTDAMMLDLGLLTLNNSLNVLSTDDKERNAILDKLEIVLTGLKLSRYGSRKYGRVGFLYSRVKE